MFGGQVVGQALVAAQKTVSEGILLMLIVKHLFFYFFLTNKHQLLRPSCFVLILKLLLY